MIDEQQKRKLIKDLEKSGNVYLACLKNNIGRATYYRWIQEDKQFKRLSTKAVRHGRENNVDVAEHSLMINVKDKKMDAIKYVLSHNSKRYKQRRESKATISYDIPIKNTDKPRLTLEDLLREDADKKIDAANQDRVDPSD